MMVGLPGVGKTTWVRQYLREHPQEQWTLISTDTVLSAMKVNGMSRRRVHQVCLSILLVCDSSFRSFPCLNGMNFENLSCLP